MDNMADIVEDRTKCDDDRFVSLIEAMVSRTVERDITSLEEVIQFDRTFEDRHDMLWSVIIVPESDDRINVLCLDECHRPWVVLDRTEDRIESVDWEGMDLRIKLL